MIKLLREIEFRGKNLETGEWVYGFLFKQIGRLNGIESIGYYIGKTLDDYQEIDLETIGQFTNKRDINGKKIYEWDLIKTKNKSLAKEDDILAVKYSGSSFVVYNPLCCDICKNGIGCIGYLDEFDQYDIIGTIFDNEM
jgi:hypothetical protein